MLQEGCTALHVGAGFNLGRGWIAGDRSKHAYTYYANRVIPSLLDQQPKLNEIVD